MEVNVNGEVFYLQKRWLALVAQIRIGDRGRGVTKFSFSKFQTFVLSSPLLDLKNDGLLWTVINLMAQRSDSLIDRDPDLDESNDLNDRIPKAYPLPVFHDDSYIFFILNCFRYSPCGLRVIDILEVWDFLQIMLVKFLQSQVSFVTR